MVYFNSYTYENDLKRVYTYAKRVKDPTNLESLNNIIVVNYNSTHIYDTRSTTELQ